MLSQTLSAATYGIDAYLIEVEVDIRHGMSGFIVVGLPDAAVRESRERVESAIKNSGYRFPGINKRVTVNLAPADVKKEGSSLDLPMAVGLLAGAGMLDVSRLRNFLIVGELSLDGTVRPVRGGLPIALTAKKEGKEGLILPEANAREAAVVDGLPVYGVKSLAETVGFFTGEKVLEPVSVDLEDMFRQASRYEVDFRDVKGQAQAKRALEVAASGAHNILLIGPPGAGKTMLARRLPTVLPDMSLGEALETTKIHSVAGCLAKGHALVAVRPFRSPHHTISNAGLIGGGSVPVPGEVSLAHHGVLFLDELPEFKRDVLEVLRQPLEDREVTIARVARTVTFPSTFMLVASMNPCPCGFQGAGGLKTCSCTPRQVERYLSKISGPLLDRIDMHLDVPPVPVKELANGGDGEPSSAIRVRVNAARALQLARFKGRRIFFNAQMGPKDLGRFCALDAASQRLLESSMEKFGLSARAHDRILKVARTCADLEGAESLAPAHVAEAVGYRTLERRGLKI